MFLPFTRERNKAPDNTFLFIPTMERTYIQRQGISFMKWYQTTKKGDLFFLQLIYWYESLRKRE